MNTKTQPKVKRYMNFVKREDMDILVSYKLKTKEEFAEYYSKLYQNLTEKPLNCVPLNSVNPAYNPYHPLLIKTSNRKRANIINTMGSAYGGNTNKHLNKSYNITK